ncbi:MAG: hypothetical protein L3K06_08830, partial [Thermoplasmata archaeon]|nr:hypothetical protein [Thermoplasmata archaeon]
FEEGLETVARDLPIATAPADRQTLADILTAVRDDSLALFHALDRIRVVPTPPGTVVIEGYVPEPDVERFRTDLGSYLVSAVPIERHGQEDAWVPTLLVNPRMIGLFERLTTQRGIPRYSEIDPTPIVALVFPLFFGIMFGDLGHGVTLLVVGTYLALRSRYEYWGRLIVAFGVSSSAVGFLRGTFFGVTFTTPFHQILALPPALSASLTFSYIPLLLEVSLLIGAVHLGSAYVIAVANQLRSLRYAEAVTNGLPTLVLYACLVPFTLAVVGAGGDLGTIFSNASDTPFFEAFFGIPVPISVTALLTVPPIVGALSVMILGPAVLRYRATRRWRKIPRSLAEGLYVALSRPAEFALNTVSYIRLAALLITNTLLSSLIAGALAYGVPGLLLAGVLNVLLMAMEGVIVFLQDMRLHWLEWLPKFYAGTGTAFAPLQGPVGASV